MAHVKRVGKARDNRGSETLKSRVGVLRLGYSGRVVYCWGMMGHYYLSEEYKPLRDGLSSYAEVLNELATHAWMLIGICGREQDDISCRTR